MVAVVLFVGSDIYVRHQFAVLAESGQIAEEARRTEQQSLLETQQELEAYMRTLEGGVNTEVTALDEASSTEVVEVAVETTTPVVVPVKTAPVKTATPAVTQPAITEAELAKLQAQIDAAKKATDALATPTKTSTVTPTKTTTVTPVKTTVVKPSRQSRAS